MVIQWEDDVPEQFVHKEAEKEPEKIEQLDLSKLAESQNDESTKKDQKVEVEYEKGKEDEAEYNNVQHVRWNPEQ